MSDDFQQLVEATIEHLQVLKARGTRFVAVDPATLAALSAPVARRPSPPPMTPTPASTAGRPAQTPAVAPPPAPAKPVTQDRLAVPANGQGAVLQPLQAPETPPPAAPLSPELKAQAMLELRQRAEVCGKCQHLAGARKHVVFGVGDIHAPLMFVGEAPGAEEDAQGEPFVGAAGQLLTKIIQATGHSRSQVYIANILKCRPDTPGQAYGNRKPTPEEMKTCLPYLQAQIDLIQPRVLVALGATAVEGLLGKTIGITKLRGHWQTYRGIPLMPTYHPAYLLRNQARSEKRKVWEDLLAVMEKLGLEITEKQRRYFQA